MNELALFSGVGYNKVIYKEGFMQSKLCSKCKNNLPLSSFYKRTDGNLYHSSCKICERAMAKDWYERNKEKANAKVKDWRIKNADAVKKYRIENRQKIYKQEVVRKYGVETNWFDNKLKLQKNVCACCSKPFQWGNKQTTPHVDHCHIKNKVRGILCNRCNTVLGLCEDKKELFINLIGYLECHG